jgi:lipopolysaccharide transport system ATP-binding protein
MRPIITVENLSKRFRINPVNRTAVRYDTLRESLVEALKVPLRRVRANGLVSEETLWALKGVSFNVMPGEVMGVIGANGAGKSTLLSVLSRIIEPTAGRAELFGRVASLLEVGTGFHPDLSGRENIYLNGAVLGMRRREIDEHFDEIVSFAEVEEFIDTAVKRYSSGMYVRLAFAVAAHLNPEILLVDEVLAVSDASFQRKCLGKMDEVTQNGRTILLVTHNLDVIAKLCGRAIFLTQGQVAVCGPAQEALNCYIATSSESSSD